MGVGRYQLLDQLSKPSEDADRMAGLLQEFGYQPVPFHFGDYSSTSHVRDVLGNWCIDVNLGPDDVLVLYFAGHGVLDDRHYLMCWNSDPRALAATALATEDTVRLLTKTGLGHLLVVLDTCYGGDGAADGAQLALRTIAQGLTAARQGSAADGVFATTIPYALQRVGDRTGNKQR